MPCETTTNWNEGSSLMLERSPTEVEENLKRRDSSDTPAPTCDSSVNTQDAAQGRRKRKKKRTASRSAAFQDLYTLTDVVLGKGAYAVVVKGETNQGTECAVKVIEKVPGYSRTRVFKEIDMFYHCGGHENITRYIEFFEETDRFYLVFEKVNGGPLLSHIQKRSHLTEREASHIVRDIASALQHMHKKGIAHRDLKPENILCANEDTLCPIKICDFDLGSGIKINPNMNAPVSTPELHTPVGSAEYMAPEVVETFVNDDACAYDKRCDLWSLGVITYILLCGYPPFFGDCETDCGWNRGAACNKCRSMLFDNIKNSSFKFPKKEWAGISIEAKELINLLLKKNPQHRATADDVLKHPWIKNEGSTALLNTPNVIRKNNSALELSQLADSANNLNRVLVQQFGLDKSTTDEGQRSQTEFTLSCPSKSSLMKRRLKSKSGDGKE